PGIDGNRCLGPGFFRPPRGRVRRTVKGCRCVALGQPNVGKTVFTLQFAAYVGVRRLHMAFAETDGRQWRRVLAVDDAVKELVAPTPHFTRRLQTVHMDLPGPKGVKTLELVDTSGLVDGIHPSPAVR